MGHKGEMFYDFFLFVPFVLCVCWFGFLFLFHCSIVFCLFVFVLWLLRLYLKWHAAFTWSCWYCYYLEVPSLNMPSQNSAAILKDIQTTWISKMHTLDQSSGELILQPSLPKRQTLDGRNCHQTYQLVLRISALSHSVLPKWPMDFLSVIKWLFFLPLRCH